MLLVPAHLSALFSSTHTISVPTSSFDAHTPDPPFSPSLHPQHASLSALYRLPSARTVLLRVTHDSRVLQLISLSAEVPPLRFDFPAPLLPAPALLVWQNSELHILAVTITGSLYRIILPVSNDHPLWHPNRHSSREYVIQNMPSHADALVQVHGTHSVAISLPNGSLLRLDAEHLADDDLWKETRFSPHSFLSSFTSLLPTRHGGPQGSSDIISMASYPPPTDIGHTWTLSRDRTLRLWTARGGCVAEKTLPAVAPGKPVTTVSGSHPNAVKPSVLLPPESQKLLSVFSLPDMPVLHVLAFIPTESSSTHGGFFQLFNASDDALRLINFFEASESSAHCLLQDFVMVGTTLYTLWDKQGQSMVEQTAVSVTEKGRMATAWASATYAQESELTPSYLDELLLSRGSLADKFFEAIMRPGIFSPLTLQTAIDQYTDVCRSLPPPYPPQLLTTYTTVGEQIAAVVGCTVTLTRDPNTGAPQHDKYWNALKRDWEGFIARCRELERSARWPLVIGPGDSKDGILVVERERVASLVEEDDPLELHRRLSISSPLEPQHALLEILWMLRTKIGPRSMLTLENRLIDIVQQETAFPYADIIQDQADHMDFHGQLDEGLSNWITGGLQGVGEITDAVQFVLEIIYGLDSVVKSEEDDVVGLPPLSSELARALTASYVTVSVHARYDLCLSLVTLLFFLSESLSQWSQALLAEIFVVFRGTAMLRHVVRQPAGDSVAPSPLTDVASTAPDEDVIAKMRNMHVSAGRTGFRPTYALVHRLVAQYGGEASDVLGSAHNFLDATGLLQSVSPAHATRPEVLFCERLRLLGYREAAREILAWLPRTPGVTYVLGRLWLDEGRYDDAAAVMESLAGSFGPDSALSTEDQQALAAVLPGAELFNSEFDFYLHAAGLFRTSSVTSHEVVFSQLALSVAPSGSDTASLWHGVIKSLTDLGLFEDAYTTLVATPYDRLKRECISHLVYRMCEEHAVERLMAFNFANFADEVEDALSFKARNADPRVRPFYSRILYTWYVSRGDYRNAALTMYQRARKLAAVIREPSNFVNLAELQLEAYVVGMNALELTDQKNAWIVMPVTVEAEHEPRKRRKLSKHIPEGRYALGKRDAEVVELADIQFEYALLSARLELIRKDPTLLSAGESFLTPHSIVLRLAQANRFNTAIATARSLNVDMSELFGYLAGQCLRLSRNPEAVIGEDTSDWLLTDKVSSWPGTAADRGWRYLRQSLERHDGPGTDYRYTKVTLEIILESDRLSPPPPWLIHSLETQHPEWLIRTCLRYEVLESALEHTLSLMRRSDARLAQEQPRTASATWLPYTLIDQVLLAAESQDDLSARGQGLSKELRGEIVNRIKRVQKYSQAAR
ncbi:nucleoporin Nup120/160-domain-containing protein [Amylocystis lapponica]|nr:nucleoporin Nup120/160-domain-containing protein [Amylocystis lapponica]